MRNLTAYNYFWAAGTVFTAFYATLNARQWCLIDLGLGQGRTPIRVALRGGLTFPHMALPGDVYLLIGDVVDYPDAASLDINGYGCLTIGNAPRLIGGDVGWSYAWGDGTNAVHFCLGRSAFPRLPDSVLGNYTITSVVVSALSPLPPLLPALTGRQLAIGALSVPAACHGRVIGVTFVGLPDSAKSTIENHMESYLTGRDIPERRAVGGLESGREQYTSGLDEAGSTFQLPNECTMRLFDSSGTDQGTGHSQPEAFAFRVAREIMGRAGVDHHVAVVVIPADRCGPEEWQARLTSLLAPLRMSLDLLRVTVIGVISKVDKRLLGRADPHSWTATEINGALNNARTTDTVEAGFVTRLLRIPHQRLFWYGFVQKMNAGVAVRPDFDALQNPATLVGDARILSLHALIQHVLNTVHERIDS